MSWKRKLIWSLLAVTLIIPFISTTIKVNIIPHAHASPDNTISIMPSNTTDLGLVVGDTFAVNITVDYVELLWQWQFELYYNPEVIHGVWYDEDLGYPVEPDPDGFLESEGGTMIVADSDGWNNTQGKMWLASAHLFLEQNPVNGSGVLARATFEVVGKGESNITLGAITALYNLDGIITTGRVPGYFRNVLTTEIPTASFTYSPVDTPEPLQGYYTEFDGTDSTATGGKTIDKYKWYFWANYSQRSLLYSDQPKFRPDGDGTYTDWTNNWDDWNDTAASTYVYANAGDMYESSTLHDHATEIYTIGKVRVTIVAKNIVSDSDERVQIMLVIGGTRYYGADYNLTLINKEYISDWATNPATGSAWTWSDVDSLEAGVRSLQQGASWTGEIRISELYIEPIQSPIVDVDVDTIYQNVTRRGPWNVTLTVTDSDGVVGTTTQGVTVKGHDVAVVDITTDAPRTDMFPPGVKYADIGEIVPINVTVENQGDFAEQHSPSSNFTVTTYYEIDLGEGIYSYTIIDTVNVTTPLAAGVNTTLTLLWDTSGCNQTFPDVHILNATVTRVQYEYEMSDNTLDDAKGFRVRFHDVAITEVEVYPHVTLKPDGDGTFTDWTGTYEDWDDWPEHNEDANYISATTDAMNQSSTLEDHTVEIWSIERVRVVAFARGTSLPTEEFMLMLVIGGEAFDATEESLTLSYSEYSYEWETNPLTDLKWTWSDLDSLEAGVRSLQDGGSWTGEVRVTQLYVEVFGVAPGPVPSGGVNQVMVTVENQGDFTETAISVTAYYNGDPIGTQTIHQLTNSSYGSATGASPFETANFTATLMFDWDTSGISPNEYTISANTSLVPDDYDPYDNTFVNGDMNVTTPRQPSTLTISASPSTITYHSITTLSGSLTPALQGENITIQYRIGGGDWIDLTWVLTDGSGQYSYDWNATEEVGTYQFMASWPGDLLYLPAESSAFNVVVTKIVTSITLTISPKTITMGQNLNFSGTITPVLEGVRLTIFYRTTEATSWTDLTGFHPLTDANGKFSYAEWDPNVATTYEFKASWDGDVIHEGADSNIVTVTVLPEEAVDFTLPALAVVGVIIIVVVLIYFLKVRKKS